MMFDEQRFQKRQPIWAALSDLWLDTELTDLDLERIARVMADSGFSIEALREIYLIEVAPVVSPNLLYLLSIADVWTGFDERWLCAHRLE